MRKKDYPANLFHALGLDEGPASRIIQNGITPDQEKGLEFVFELHLTPREHYVLQNFYQSMTEKELGEELNVPPARVRQIRMEALNKLKKSQLWPYVLEGYEVRTERLTKEIAEQEKLYQMMFPESSMDKNLSDFPISARTVNALHRAEITTVREILSVIAFAPVMRRIRNFGEVSYAETVRVLVQHQVLPLGFESMEQDAHRYSLDCVLASLCYINTFSGQ